MCWSSLGSLLKLNRPSYSFGLSGSVKAKVDAWFIDFEYTIWEGKYPEN